MPRPQGLGRRPPTGAPRRSRARGRRLLAVSSEDFRPELAASKIETYAVRHRMLRNCWVEGSGFLMKRECVVSNGLLPGAMGFPTYRIHLAAAGWINGWYYPFVHQEHMDDPRSSYWLPQPQRLAATASTILAVAKAGPREVERVQRIRRRGSRRPGGEPRPVPSPEPPPAGSPSGAASVVLPTGHGSGPTE